MANGNEYGLLLFYGWESVLFRGRYDAAMSLRQRGFSARRLPQVLPACIDSDSFAVVTWFCRDLATPE